MASKFEGAAIAKTREEKLARLQELSSLKATISSELQAMSIRAITAKVDQKFHAHKQHHDESVLKARKAR